MPASRVPSLKRRLAEGLLVVLVLAFVGTRILRLAGELRADSADRCSQRYDFNIEGGEALIHGYEDQGYKGSMPAFSTTHALFCSHVPEPLADLFPALILPLSVALVFGLGLMLHSGLCGAAGTLIYALAVRSEWVHDDRGFYGLVVLLVAYLLVWRARSRTLARTTALGAALGTSLLFFSALCFFSPLLLGYEYFMGGKRPGAFRGRLKSAALLVLLPVLFLIPWILMNWSMERRVIIFEDGRADSAVVMGAAGFTTMLGGVVDVRKLVGIPEGVGSLSWSVQNILSNPLSYAVSIIRRAWYVFTLQPFLWIFGLAGLGLYRKMETFRQLGLFIFYFTAIHCLVAVDDTFFYPLWPILAAASAVPFSIILGPPREKNQGPFPSFLAWALLAPVAGLAIYSLGLVAAFPSRAGAPDALARELGKYPDEWWLWSVRGWRRFERGELTGAIADFQKARALYPSTENELRYAWALLIKGGPEQRKIWEDFDPEGPGPMRGFRRYFLKTLFFLQNGRPAEARKTFIRALSRVSDSSADDGDSPLENKGILGGLEASIKDILVRWPTERRVPLISGLRALAAGDRRSAPLTILFTGLLVDAAVEAEKNGKSDVALEVLKQAQSMPLDSGPAAANASSNRAPRTGVLPDSGRRFEMARLYGRLGKTNRAYTILKRLAGESPDDASLQMGFAHAAVEAGDSEAALAALAGLDARDLTKEQIRENAALYLKLKAFDRSLRLASRLHDAEFLLQIAHSAADAGDSEVALAALGRAKGAKLPLTVARLYARLGKIKRAYAILKRVADENSDDPSLQTDFAYVAADAGDRRAALAALEGAVGASPPLAVARRIGELYGKLGSHDTAITIFKGLSARHPLEVILYMDLALAQERAGRPAQALETLKKAETLRPGRRQLRHMGLLYRNLGAYDRALILLGNMAADADILLDMAATAAEGGRYEAAAGYLRRANGESLPVDEINRMALIYQRIGRHARALSVFDRLIRSEPREPRWRANRGVLKAVMGNNAQAIADLRGALDEDPGYSEASLTLGSLYAGLGRREEALKTYDRALAQRARPKDKDILEMIRAERRRLSKD